MLQHRYARLNAIQAEQRGARLGGFLYCIDRKHRERTKANLAIAFPEWDEKKRHEVAREVYRHFGRVMGDFVRSGVRTPQEVNDSIEAEGAEIFDQLVSEGRGMIGVTAHFGNWERFAQWVAAKGIPVSVVARDANQEGVQEMVSQLREKTGVSLLSRGNAARQILTKLRNGEFIGILPDQNADECFVPFFGKPAGTVMGPAVLHMRTKAAIIPCYCVRIGPGKYKVIVRPPIDPDCIEKNPEEITRLINVDLEFMVRQYPEQYLWLHDRWKEARRRGML